MIAPFIVRGRSRDHGLQRVGHVGFAKATWVLIDHGKPKNTHPASQHSMDVQSLLNKNRGKTRHPSTTNNFEVEEMQQKKRRLKPATPFCWRGKTRWEVS